MRKGILACVASQFISLKAMNTVVSQDGKQHVCQQLVRPVLKWEIFDGCSSDSMQVGMLPDRSEKETRIKLYSHTSYFCCSSLCKIDSQGDMLLTMEMS